MRNSFFKQMSLLNGLRVFAIFLRFSIRFHPIFHLLSPPLKAARVAKCPDAKECRGEYSAPINAGNFFCGKKLRAT